MNLWERTENWTFLAEWRLKKDYRELTPVVEHIRQLFIYLRERKKELKFIILV